MSYPVRWTVRDGPARRTMSATSWAGASRGQRPRGPGGLPLGPCLDAVRKSRDDGAGGLPGGRSGFRSCRLGRSQMPVALSPASESGRQGTGRLRSRRSPRVPGLRGRFTPWPSRDGTGLLRAALILACPILPAGAGQAAVVRATRHLQAAAPRDPGPAQRAPSLPTSRPTLGPSPWPLARLLHRPGPITAHCWAA